MFDIFSSSTQPLPLFRYFALSDTNNTPLLYCVGLPCAFFVFAWSNSSRNKNKSANGAARKRASSADDAGTDKRRTGDEGKKSSAGVAEKSPATVDGGVENGVAGSAGNGSASAAAAGGGVDGAGSGEVGGGGDKDGDNGDDDDGDASSAKEVCSKYSSVILAPQNTWCH